MDIGLTLSELKTPQGGKLVVLADSEGRSVVEHLGEKHLFLLERVFSRKQAIRRCQTIINLMLSKFCKENNIADINKVFYNIHPTTSFLVFK